jgi:hypothetical protein
MVSLWRCQRDAVKDGARSKTFLALVHNKCLPRRDRPDRLLECRDEPARLLTTECALHVWMTIPWLARKVRLPLLAVHAPIARKRGLKGRLLSRNPSSLIDNGATCKKCRVVVAAGSIHGAPTLPSNIVGCSSTANTRLLPDSELDRAGVILQRFVCVNVNNGTRVHLDVAGQKVAHLTSSNEADASATFLVSSRKRVLAG